MVGDVLRELGEDVGRASGIERERGQTPSDERVPVASHGVRPV
jgi:hypothetical protein